MEIELIEIRDFLAHRTPFDVLPADALDQLPSRLIIRYLRRGSEFPPSDVDDGHLYIVRSGAVELRDAQGQLFEKLGEGDLYSLRCSPPGGPEEPRGIAAEDSLFYLLPCRELEVLRTSSEVFDRHFSESLGESVRLALSTTAESGVRNLSSMTLEVGDLLRREPVVIDTDTSIRQAAQLMSEQKLSSLMVLGDGKLVGLITDSDLRRRCIADGISTEQPASTIMTTTLETIQKDALLSEALLTMTRLNVHHLPVMDDETLAGMITVSDLIRHQSTNSALIATDVHKARTVEELAQISRRIPELQLQLSRSNATAQHVGEAVACITDAITQKLISMAEANLGPPPVAYVWAAGGSQARREQTSHSDQDNALIISDAMTAEHEKYFTDLSKYVSDGLHACGFVYCPGNAMASNRQWRQPLRVWHDYFSDWIERPQPKALMLSSIFFDLRAVHGDTDLLDTLQEAVLQKTRANRIFIAYMVSNALSHRPPLGFFRNFVLIHGGEHDETLDIKHRGIVPIVDIARVYALSEGLPAVNSSERLQAASDSGALSKEMSANLQDALEFISTLRIQHQARQIRSAEKPDNYLSPSEISELDRRHLKDAFRIIQSIQETLDSRYQAGRFA